MLELFYMDISCDCPYGQSQAFYRILPEERQKKIDKMVNTELAKKRILAGIFMQYGLSIVTGIPMENIRYVYGKQGKPYLDERQFYKTEKQCENYLESVHLPDEEPSPGHLDFNLSHSGKYVVLAVSDKPVGIDVEQKKKNRLSVAKRFFCKKEYTDIMVLPDEESRNRKFIEYWTMKEAYVKRMGEGLHIPLCSFEIKPGGGMISFVDPAENDGDKKCQDGRIWLVTGVMEHGEYAVSVCSEDVEELESLAEFSKTEDADKDMMLGMTKVTMEQIASNM